MTSPPPTGVADLRRSFLRFFEGHGHRAMSSIPLVPAGDPTLLFTSAGMVQFKPFFMGLAEPPARRLASVQKCFRTTDIDEVGDDSHLTFFEMLGNFSVGDYFKRGAVQLAWEYLTQVLRLPPERLWATIYLDDEEAHQAWLEVGVPPERIFRYGEERNYWFLGPVGPCGPCSEIYYDFAPEDTSHACEPAHGEEHGRFLEIWNLVFMMYYQSEDGSRTELPTKNIDTGAGLERLATVMQGKRSVYDTDVFRPVLVRVEELAGKRYDPAGDPEGARAMRVVAEHARALAFLLADGIAPSNEGRGYVVRRLLRRAAYFARTLGLEGSPLAATAEAVVGQMAAAYPELKRQREGLLRLLRAEEERFGKTLRQGSAVLNGLLDYREQHSGALEQLAEWGVSRKLGSENAAGVLESYGFTGGEGGGHYQAGQYLAAEAVVRRYYNLLEAVENEESPDVIELLRQGFVEWGKRLTGDEVFALSDTYGFPRELTAEIARARGFSLDSAGFEALMRQQRERARAAQRFALDEDLTRLHASLAHLSSPFVGYETTVHTSRVTALLVGREEREAAGEGEEVTVFLAETPFYPEGGGQVGDAGTVTGPEGTVEIYDTLPVGEGLIAHHGHVVRGSLRLGDEVRAEVDALRRADSMRNHTATHLLHAALRQVLGGHVRQTGSLVAPDRLRFDFSHTQPVTPEELREVQRLVNDNIRQDVPLHVYYTSFRQAMEEGVLAFFGDKYGEEVRVVKVPHAVALTEHGPYAPPGTTEARVVEVASSVTPFSAELCGGTHCARTGQVGAFFILGEGSVGAGIRRIEAVSGRGAEDWIEEQREQVQRLARQLNAPLGEIESRIAALQTELAEARRQLAAAERERGRQAVEELLSRVHRIDGTAVLAAQVEASSMDALRQMGDQLRDRLGSAVVVLGAVFDARPNFLAMATPDVTARGLHAGQLLKEVAAVAGGGGGGRPELAQAGGKDPGRLAEALQLAERLVRQRLSGG